MWRIVQTRCHIGKYKENQNTELYKGMFIPFLEHERANAMKIERPVIGTV